MVDIKTIGKRVFKRLLQLSVVGSITFLLFELCFRLYLIDFYAGEFEYLNTCFTDRDTEKNIVIIGDSFSAFKNGYSKTLYDSLPTFSIRNYSVAGTSIREQYPWGKFHIKRDKPEVLIFQFYVGNDLFGWNHLEPEGDISLVRNTYWEISEYLWSLNFINYKMAGIRAKHRSPAENRDSAWYQGFDPERFTYRDRLYFKAEPYLIENAAYLKNGRGEDLKAYMSRMKKLFEFAGPNCKVYVLTVPHAAQVNETYLGRTRKLGAGFTTTFQTGQNHYPLLDEMIRFFSDDKRVKVLNPISALKDWEEKSISVYYPNDSHLTKAGQSALGQFLLEELRKESGF